MPTDLDKWGDWLTSRRFGNDKNLALQTIARLEVIRDRLLRDAIINEGSKVLDVGTGDGLIGLEALKYVGNSGKVYFSDISNDALEICRQKISSTYEGKFDFFLQSADNLDLFDENDLDVVTARAAVMYVSDKQKAFREFYRVLRPGGRLSIFEPINKFSALHSPSYLDLDFSELDAELAKKLLHPLGYPLDTLNNPMLNFDERDLFRFAEEAGFKDIKVDNSLIKTSRIMLQPWEVFLESSANPLTPPMKDILSSLKLEEKRVAINFLLNAWKRPLRSGYHAETYLIAVK